MKKNKKLATYTLLGSLTMFATYLLNKLTFTIACMKGVLYSKNGSYYQWRFGRIFYTKQGKGSPVLLVHDLTNASSDMEYKYLIDQLSKEHQVYTLDLLGCGRSEKPKITYTSYLYVQLITDFIKHIIGSKTNIIATSASASLAIMACHAESELFENLLLLNPENFRAINKIPTTKHKLLKYFLELPIIGTLTYNIVSSKQVIHKRFIKQYYACGYKAKRNLIDAYYEAAHKGGSSSKYIYASIKAHYTNTNIIHAIKSINNSIYIAVGEAEPHGLDTIADYLTCNPAIESSVIPRSKHLPQMENPSEILSICNIFF